MNTSMHCCGRDFNIEATLNKLEGRNAYIRVKLSVNHDRWVDLYLTPEQFKQLQNIKLSEEK